MLESSAATQITPGAIERSRLGSAPTPSGNRLVEQPQRPRLAQREPRQRRTPALALREPFHQAVFFRQPEPRQRFEDQMLRYWIAGETAGDRKVLCGGEVILDRRGVAEIH